MTTTNIEMLERAAALLDQLPDAVVRGSTASR